jgi:hypothetical protein
MRSSKLLAQSLKHISQFHLSDQLPSDQVVERVFQRCPPKRMVVCGTIDRMHSAAFQLPQEYFVHAKVREHCATPTLPERDAVTSTG